MQNKKDGCFKYIKKLKVKYFLFSIIIISLIISTFKLLEYKTDDFSFQQVGVKDFPSEKRTLVYCIEFDYRLNECGLFNGIKLFNSLINNIIFFILTIILDIVLLNGITDVIRHKKKVIENLKLEEEEKKKKKLSIMILINGIVYIISHLPEFLTMTLLIIYQRDMSEFCLQRIRCDKLNEMAQFFNYISIILQFSINKNFNKIFSETYQEIINRIKKRFNCYEIPNTENSSNNLNRGL